MDSEIIDQILDMPASAENFYDEVLLSPNVSDYTVKVFSTNKSRIYSINAPSGEKFILKAALRRHKNNKEFSRELSIHRRISHDSITQVVQSGDDWILMEDVGDDLRVLDLDGNISTDIAIRLTYQTAEALEYLHNYRDDEATFGIVHFDIKQENILLVRGSDKIKLIDFGISFFEGNYPYTGSPQGSFSCMSPEQTQEFPAVINHKSDIFSLGVLFYEFLTGKCPWDFQPQPEKRVRKTTQKYEQGSDIAYNIRYGKHKSLSQIMRNGMMHRRRDRNLSRLVDAMLEKYSGDRPEASEVMGCLESM